ncbi:MAG TPA: hypothetical protein VIK12_01705 [Pengzhenrongella sp.]
MTDDRFDLPPAIDAAIPYSGRFVARPDDAVVAIDAALWQNAIDVRAWSIERHPGVPWTADPTLGWYPSICLAERFHAAGGLPGACYVCTRIPDHTGRHAAGMLGQLVAVWGDAS